MKIIAAIAFTLLGIFILAALGVAIACAFSDDDPNDP